jgi:hypothetical protein
MTPPPFDVSKLLARLLPALDTVKPLPSCPVCSRASIAADTLCERCNARARALGVRGCGKCGRVLAPGSYDGAPTLCRECSR